MHKPDTAEVARTVLATNDRGDYTAPDGALYPHQWLWDSCFIAIGLRHSNVARAQTEIRHLLDAQWHNGMVPHIVFNPDLAYAAERRVWQSQRNPASPDTIATSGLTQPPLLAEAVVRIGQKLPATERRSWYKQAFPALLRYHQWLYRERDPAGSGLVCLVHPWESGMDNTPPWMAALYSQHLPLWWHGVRLTHSQNLFNRFRRDLQTIPVVERYDTLDALALFAAHRRLFKLHYDSRRMLRRGGFAIQDLAFNAILIRNNEHLASMATFLGLALPADLQTNMERSHQALEELWSVADKQYFSRDSRSGQLLTQPSVATLLPLYAGSISKARAELLVTTWLEDEHQYGAFYPLPSVPISSDWFGASHYWQGPTWLNINWLVIDGLRRYGFKDHAAALRDSSLAMVGASGFREYFNPLSGEGLGAQDFSWTAALTLDMLKS